MRRFLERRGYRAAGLVEVDVGDPECVLRTPGALAAHG